MWGLILSVVQILFVFGFVRGLIGGIAYVFGYFAVWMVAIKDASDSDYWYDKSDANKAGVHFLIAVVFMGAILSVSLFITTLLMNIETPFSTFINNTFFSN